MVECNYIAIFVLFFGCFAHHATADFNIAAPNIPVENFVLQGNGSVTANGVTLTLDQPTTGSVAYYNVPQNVLDGFTTTLIYQSTGCDTLGWANGADGIAFFIASEINTNQDISFGSSLGLNEKTNIAVVGFVMWEGRLFYTASAIGQTIGPVNNVDFIRDYSMQAWRCTSPVSITIDYTPPSAIKITVPFTNTDQTIALNIPQYFAQPVQQYIGLSGATGDGFMKQTISSWTYTSKVYLVPILECYEEIDGSYIAHFGFINDGVLSTSRDIGPENSFSGPNADRGQPTTFPSGRSQYYPANAFSIPWDGQQLTWTLADHQLTINSGNTNNLCPSSLKLSVTFTVARNLTDAEILAIKQSIATLLQISVDRITVIGYVYEYQGGGTKRAIYLSDQATLELEIAGAAAGSNEPSAAQSVQTFIQTTKNTTTINQVLNPDGGSTVGYTSTSLKETGAESFGEKIAPPSATPIDTTPPLSAPIDVPVSSEPSNSEVPITSNQPQSQTPGSAVPIKETTPQQSTDVKSNGSVIIMPIYALVIMFVFYVM